MSLESSQKRILKYLSIPRRASPLNNEHERYLEKGGYFTSLVLFLLSLQQQCVLRNHILGTTYSKLGKEKGYRRNVENFTDNFRLVNSRSL